MERILIFGFAGIMIVMIVGFAFVVGALRNLVSAVVMLSVKPEEMETDEEKFMHDLAGLSLLRIKNMMTDEEYEQRKAELMKKYGK